MTKTKKSTRKTTTKKTSKKNQSRFYVIQSLTEAKENISEKIERYNKHFFIKPLETGKEFLDDLKKSPRKTLEDLMNESKEFVTDLKKDTRKKIDTFVDDGKNFIKKAQKNPRKVFSGLVDEWKEDAREKMDGLKDDYKKALKGIEKDAGLVKKDLLDSGKKAVNRIPGKKEFEKKIESIPTRFNLPSKKDIDILVRNMKQLNEKVDNLSKQYAA